MSDKRIPLNDKISTHDECGNKIKPMRMEEQNKVFRTQIIGLDSLTGEKLWETENQIVLGGALFILEKCFNVEAPITVDYINNIMGINTADPIEEIYP